jgi:phosphoesterase RecJ-like protein
VPVPSLPAGAENRDRAELADSLRAATALIRSSSSVTVLCHENPDADTLGGGLALESALRGLGIRSEIVCGTGWPATLAFLPLLERVRSRPCVEPDAIVLVDCASIDRVGAELASWVRSSSAPIVNVDHHISNSRYGIVACIDPAAAATSEIVAHLITELDCAWDKDSATLLLAGILHDTDGLRVPETSATTLRLAADLAEAGAELGAINQALFARRPLPALRLWGLVATELEVALDGRVVVGTLTADMLTATGASLIDAEDLPDMLGTVDGVEIAVLLREVGEQATRVSIRTAGRVSAAALASQFGGGGHERAAGCTIAADRHAARNHVLSACDRYFSSPYGAANPQTS